MEVKGQSLISETNTPVQTPSSDPFFNGHKEESIHQTQQSLKGVEPEKPLSPPNPSPSPEKHKLEEDLESERKRNKTMDSFNEDSGHDSNDEHSGDLEVQERVQQVGIPRNPQFTEPAPVPPAEPDMNNLPSNPMPKHQAKFALNTIKAVKRLRESGPFVRPVDIVKLKIPFYYNYITKPMDLSTIERKLSVNAYEESREVVNDFNLMVDNCTKYNGELSNIAKMAKNIQAHFEKHMLNMPPKVLPSNGNITLSHPRRRTVVVDSQEAKRNSVAAHRPKRVIHPPKSKELPYDVRPRKKKYAAELRFCNQTIKELVSKKHYNYNFPFLAPVDTVALNIPNYYEVVKEPMDLGTIQSKLANNEYENGDEFERDVRLVFKNCYAFNPNGNDVNLMGHKLEAIFDKRWANRPIPQPTPPTSDMEFSSGDDDDEPEINESMLSNVPAIQFLENQLIRMKQELDELKKQHLEKLREQREAKRKRKKSKRAKASRKNSIMDDGHHAPVVTYEMKKQVSEMVPNLTDKKLQSLIKIIKDDIDLSNEEEVELDMDQLEDHTVLKLYNFLFGKKASSMMHKKKKATSGAGLDQLQQLRSQLQLFDDADRPAGASMNLGTQESSDDDVSSESSEEE